MASPGRTSPGASSGGSEAPNRSPNAVASRRPRSASMRSRSRPPGRALAALACRRIHSWRAPSEGVAGMTPWWPTGTVGGTRSCASGVHLGRALEGPAEGQLVGVLEVTAHRQSAGDPGNGQPQGLEEPGEVHGRGLALEVGVGAEDHLGDPLAVEAEQELAHPELFGPNALDGIQRPLEDVVATCLLYTS